MVHMRWAEDRKRELLLLIVACLVSYSISAGIRISEYTKWNDPDLQAGGEYLLATHDAYGWVSGASGNNQSASGSASAILLRTAASILRASPANVAFWAPAFLASLVTIPLVLWSGLLGAPGLAAPTATVGALVPAFFARTRLGYFDTDWANLFFPLLIAFLFAAWLRPHLSTRNSKDLKFIPVDTPVLLPILGTLVILLGIPWHNFVRTFVVAILWLSAGLILFGTRGIRRRVLIWILIGLCTTALWGWIGALFGIALVLTVSRRNVFRTHLWVARLGAVFVLVLLTGLVLTETGTDFIERNLRYTNILPSILTNEASGQAIHYPTSGISIAELQIPTMRVALEGMAYVWWLGILGTGLFIFLLWREPIALLLLPLVLIGFTSVYLGGRFTMFGGAVVLMAAIVPIEWLVRTRWKSSPRLGLAAFMIPLVLAFIAGSVVLRDYDGLPARPILDKEHAEALLELRDLAQGEGMVWTWWDYGYATQYYARLDTFADGSRNTGPYLSALGMVFSAPESAVARNVVMFSATNDYRPWESWERQGLDDFHQLIRASSPPLLTPAGDTEQYIVVQWEVIRHLPWITYYGTWNFDDMEGHPANIAYLNKSVRIDRDEGVLAVPGEPTVRLGNLDVLNSKSIDHYKFEENSSDFHLILNSVTNEAFLLDSQAYYSTLVQLLIRQPTELMSAEPYEIVIDRSPHVRIFRIH